MSLTSDETHHSATKCNRKRKYKQLLFIPRPKGRGFLATECLIEDKDHLNHIKELLHIYFSGYKKEINIDGNIKLKIEPTFSKDKKLGDNNPTVTYKLKLKYPNEIPIFIFEKPKQHQYTKEFKERLDTLRSQERESQENKPYAERESFDYQLFCNILNQDLIKGKTGIKKINISYEGNRLGVIKNNDKYEISIELDNNNAQYKGFTEIITSIFKK